MKIVDFTHFKNFIDGLNIGVLVMDRNGDYSYVNDFYCDQVKNSREFFEHQNIKNLQRDGYLEHTVWAQVIKEKRVISSVITIRGDYPGGYMDTLSTGVPCFDEHGDVEYVFVIQESLSNLSARMQDAYLNRGIGYVSINEPVQKNVSVIAESQQMKSLLSTLSVVATTDAPVLISGASGTGKEVLASFVHDARKDNRGPFVAINCASIPENLLESELFGYSKGAFSGASSQGKRGLIETADGGTLFLDEINSLPLSFQAKLLRTLETKEVTPVGSVHSKKINFRLICASNEDLQTLISAGHFRLDLFYRINVVSVFIPPLKERKEDIVPLALHFMQYYCSKYNCIKVLSQDSLALLKNYSWPGNVRELKNFIERLVITSPKDEWEIKNINPELFEKSAGADNSLSFTAPNAAPTATPKFDFSSGATFKDFMNNYEKELLEAAIKEAGSPAEAAKLLKLDTSNVYRKLSKFK